MAPKRSKNTPVRGSRETEVFADRKEQRRAKYASDPATADAARSAARANYRNSHPIAAKLANGLLAEGVIRELDHEDLEHPVTLESFTVPEAAKALGRSEATFRRWLAADKVPEPYLRETTRGHKVYSVGELQVMYQVIQQNESEWAYLTSQSGQSHTMHEYMHAYRSHHI